MQRFSEFRRALQLWEGPRSGWEEMIKREATPPTHTSQPNCFRVNSGIFYKNIEKLGSPAARGKKKKKDKIQSLRCQNFFFFNLARINIKIPSWWAHVKIVTDTQVLISLYLKFLHTYSQAAWKDAYSFFPWRAITFYHCKHKRTDQWEGIAVYQTVEVIIQSFKKLRTGGEDCVSFFLSRY